MHSELGNDACSLNRDKDTLLAARPGRPAFVLAKNSRPVIDEAGSSDVMRSDQPRLLPATTGRNPDNHAVDPRSRVLPEVDRQHPLLADHEGECLPRADRTRARKHPWA